MRAYHATEAYKKALRKRQVWVEPLFAEGKDWHGMRRFRLRRLWRVNSEALMIATGLNLKRLLKKRGWGRRPCPAEALHAPLFGYLLLLPLLLDAFGGVHLERHSIVKVGSLSKLNSNSLFQQSEGSGDTFPATS